MADAWQDLNSARTAAQAAEHTEAAQLAQLAAVEAQLGQIALALAAVPTQLPAAQADRDRAASAVTAAQTALTSAQSNAGQAATAAASAHAAATGAQQALDQDQLKLTALQDQLADVQDIEIGPNGKPRPGNPSEAAKLRQEIAAQNAVIAAARSRLNSATAAAAAADARSASAAAAVAPAQSALTAAQSALAAAQQQLDGLTSLQTSAQQDQPTLTAQANSLRAAAQASATQAAQAWSQFDSALAAALAPIATAREALQTARAAAVTARYRLQQTQSTAHAATRRGDPPATPDPVGAAQKAVDDADAQAASARGRMTASIAPLLGDPDPGGLIAAVPTADPLLLIPVRLETAFLDRPGGGTDLAVRVYPDTIQLDGFEPALTDVERGWGQQLRGAITAADTNAAQRAWDALVAAVGAYRAAWVLRALSGSDPGSRPVGWTPPPRMRLLPDRWVALGYLGGQRVFAQAGAPIPDDLPVLAGQLAPSGVPAQQGSWGTDLDTAVATGMAIRIALTDQQASGLDRVLVVGVRASQDAATSAGDLAALLDAHHFTDGLSLPPPGTASKAVDGRAAGALPPGRGAPTYQLEFGPPSRTPNDGSDADRASIALGLLPAAAGQGALDRVDGAGARTQAMAAQMSAALWPATWGYFLDQLINGAVAPTGRDLARRHFIDHVGALGPLPTLLVAEQPYGLLPVTSLDRYLAAADDPTAAQLAPLLRSLRAEVWRPAAAQVPCLDPRTGTTGGPSADPATSLTRVLGQQPDAESVLIRRLLGADYAWNLWSFLSTSPVDPTIWQTHSAGAHSLAALLALPSAGRIADAAFFPAAAPVSVPLVAGEGAAGNAAPAGYLQWLLSSGWQAIKDRSGAAIPDSVLFLLVRHAALRTYLDAAAVLLGLTPGQVLDPELVAVDGAQAETAWDLLARSVPGGGTVGDYLDGLRRGGAPDARLPGVPQFLEFWSAVGVLAAQAPDVLGRVLAATLDACSHRLDAWITSLSARTLDRLRGASPTGVHLGGFGWVTDLRPEPQRALAQQVAQLTASEQAATAALNAAQAHATASQAAAASAAAASTTAAQQAASDESALTSLQTKLSDLQNELTDLQRPVTGPTGKPEPQPGLAALRTQITQLQKQITDAEAALATARAAATNAAAQSESAQQAATTAQAAVVSAQGAVTQAQTALSAAQTQLSAAQSGGYEFVHAPSLAHATTAALLRSGYLAHSGEDGALAVDLSSQRVRTALRVLEGVRAGQPPGALLGYGVERGLRDAGQGGAILPLRTLSPYGELTAAEVAAAAAQAQAASLHALLDQLDSENTAAQQQFAATQSALTAANQAQASANSAKQAADAAVSQAQQALTSAQQLLAGDEDALAAARAASHIPPWKVVNGGPDPGDVADASAAVQAQTKVVAAARAALSTAQTRQTAANSALAAANAQQTVAAQTAAAAQAAITQLQSQIDTLAPQVTAADSAAQAADADVDNLRATLRDQAAEATAANSVVDGLAVYRRYSDGRRRGTWDATTIPFGNASLPPVSSPAGQAITAVLDGLTATIDGVADLGLAQSVYGLVSGAAPAAAAAADALGQFDLPPDLPVVRAPRSARALTHRLLLLGPAMPAAPAGWPSVSPRAAAEPALTALVAGLLPDPGTVRGRAQWFDPQTGATLGDPIEVTLSELGLAALDVVYAAQVDAGELVDRLLDHVAAQGAPAGAAQAAQVRHVPDRSAAWGAEIIDWPSLLAVAGALRDLLGSARAADARDMALSGEPATGGDDSVTALTARVGAAQTALSQTATTLDQAAATLTVAPAPIPAATAQTIREALLSAAAFGIPAAVPAPQTAAGAGPRWAEQLAAASAEIAGRIAALDALDAEFAAQHVAAPASGADATDHQLARAEVILGSGFHLLPRFTPANGAELAASGNDAAALTGSDPLAPWRWLAQASRVRAGARRLSDALLDADAVAEGVAKLSIMQLPHAPGGRWLALPGTGGPDDALSLVAAGLASPDPGHALAGLVVDEWVEFIPADSEQTGISFRFDAPGARPPQTLLLAVPPGAEHVWDLDTLEALLLETLELAQLRGVDFDALVAAGSPITQFLPAVYLASNAAAPTAVTDIPAAATA